MGISMESLKNYLKRFDTLVVLVRTARNIRGNYDSERRKITLEHERVELEQKRAKFIRDYLGSHSIHKIQIGAGPNVLHGWLNTDLHPSSESVCYLNALEKFPFDDNVFDYVFSEHMIEHIAYNEGLFMLRESFRILKPGGTVRIATPNVCNIIGLYSPDKTEIQKQYLCWSSTNMFGLYGLEFTIHQKSEPEWAMPSEHMRRFFPSPEQDSACFVVNFFFRSWGHKFLYDSKTLSAALQETGFVNVVECTPGESSNEHLRGIESHNSIIGEEMNRFETIVLEALRP